MEIANIVISITAMVARYRTTLKKQLVIAWEWTNWPRTIPSSARTPINVAESSEYSSLGINPSMVACSTICQTPQCIKRLIKAKKLRARARSQMKLTIRRLLHRRGGRGRISAWRTASMNSRSRRLWMKRISGTATSAKTLSRPTRLSKFTEFRESWLSLWNDSRQVGVDSVACSVEAKRSTQ